MGCVLFLGNITPLSDVKISPPMPQADDVVEKMMDEFDGYYGVGKMYRDFRAFFNAGIVQAFAAGRQQGLREAQKAADEADPWGEKYAMW